MQKVVDGRNVAVCDECAEPVPPYEHVPAGYVSPMSNTYKPTEVYGIPGVENIAKVVCRECYRLDFAKAYPNEVCPI